MPPSKLGPYAIGRQVGRGGMGTVYEGVDEETGLRAAVKVLATSLSDHPDFRERFEVEIETLRKLRHPNIVRIYGFGEQDGHLFYGMELVDGQSLEELIRDGRRFDWREVIQFGIKMARALKHAHDRGVIHRDIKPANLLLSNGGELKLTDFGIAKLFGMTGLTGAGGVVGTAEYMSPEQTMGRRVTERSDLYSLGGVMYALLAGRPPFVADSIPEMLQLQRFAEPEPLRMFASDVPRELEAIVHDLLAKDPEQRVPNAMMLARRLEATERGLSRSLSAADDAESATTRPDVIGPGAALPDDPDDSTTDPLAVTQVAGTKWSDGDAADFEVSSVDPWTQTIAATGSAESIEDESIEAAGESMAGNSAAGESSASIISTAATQAPAGEAATTETARPASHFTTVADQEDLATSSDEPESHLRLAAQIALLLVALLALAGGAWYLMTPPTADALYDRIARRVDTADSEQLVEAEDDIKQFLARFRHDARSGEVQSYLQEIELTRLEKQFNRRARRFEGSGSLSPIEQAYLEAVRYEQLDPELGRAKLQAVVDLFTDEEAGDEKSELCLELARRRLEQIEDRLGRSAGERLDVLERQFDRAASLRQSDPAKARAMWTAIVELYGDKPWAQEVVEKARTALATTVAEGSPGS